MTINELQQALIDEIERITKDMSLTDRNGGRAEIKGYPQAIPVQPVFKAEPLLYDTDTEVHEDSLFPYFVVRTDSVEYKKKESDGANWVHILIAFAIYDEDSGLKGYYTLTAVMERVVMRFQSNPVLGAYWCEHNMNVAYQEDDTFPQFFGALEMIWNLPDISTGSRAEEFYG